MMKLHLPGKTAMVTGASSGIGWSVAKALAAKGAKVAVMARRTGRLEQLVAEIEAAGGTAKAWTVDVADREALSSAYAEVEASLGPVAILVNNAGYGRFETVSDASIEDIEQVMAVNYHGTVYGMKLALPGMLERNEGHIINVASIAGEYPSPNLGSYCAAKAAVIALSKTLAAEVRETKVAVSVINPGPVATEFHSGPTWEERGPHRKEITAQPEDVAEALLAMLESRRHKVYVYAWWGWFVWFFKVAGPVGEAIVNLKRRLKLKW